MCFGDRQCQTQTKSGAGFAAAGVAAIKALENIRKILLADANAGISDFDEHILVFDLIIERNRTASRSVFDSIVRQIAEQTLQELFVPFYRNGILDGAVAAALSPPGAADF